MEVEQGPWSLADKIHHAWKTGGVPEVLSGCSRFLARKLVRPEYGFLLKSGPFTLIPGLEEGNPEAVAKARSMLRMDMSRTYSIEGHCACLCGEDTDFTDVPAAVVAHWDPQKIVDPYVEYMCRQYKAMGWKVVLASASKPERNEVLERWQEWCDAIVYRTCDGYDFTSWKAALHCLPSLLHSEFLILCNDSVFGPIGSLDAVHKKMATIQCDFWGMTASRSIAPHLQSYYLVFSKKILRHKCFHEFFLYVNVENDRENSIKYEISIAIWIALNKFKAGAYQIAKFNCIKRLDPTFYFWKGCIKNGMPFLKRRLNKYNKMINIKSYSRYYDFQLINNYFKRTYTK
ncbi:MAG: hypothetical protein IJD16_09325 [Desulfovibrio sp.]|nr:hypothetical protein [Desulfovibrio sp.]